MGRVLAITSHSEEETLALAKRLAASFVTGDLLVLTGPLGSGKTVFVRGLVQGLGLQESMVSSPSFGMVNEYPGELPLYHFDLYRIKNPAELYEIGWDDYLLRDGIVVVEWGEKAVGLLPSRYYQIDFVMKSETEREIQIALVQ
ncbi:MAG: tRNA (adenosine(37)-N6)-threonylcarbamoyltransferase complex ATPase subunit type 1 TsaE [bacterium]|nr:tRNA (adenosine(37)-N6)-threonylcarbamoyltransferase complex ATPase subunit type 1 TsaE [bacterium]